MIIFIISIGYIVDRYNLLPRKYYHAEDFNIDMIYSSWDFNENGIDDYSDFVLGARKDAKNHPYYQSAYYDGGFPPDDIGVCTDVIWRAFKEAGYDLREMVDQDIQERPEAYFHVKVRDKNIDFRRVVNLHVFFEAHALSLTTDTKDIEAWQPGDIIIFGDDDHIGIVSDRRNRQGRPYIIHNGGQIRREEDFLKRATVKAHYRFDASCIKETLLIAWEK